MFHQILPSPEVKQWEVISFKHGIYEFSHELPNDLGLWNWLNKEILEMGLNFIEWLPGAQPQCQNKNFVSTNKKVPKNRN